MSMRNTFQSVATRMLVDRRERYSIKNDAKRLDIELQSKRLAILDTSNW